MMKFKKPLVERESEANFIPSPIALLPPIKNITANMNKEHNKVSVIDGIKHIIQSYNKGQV